MTVNTSKTTNQIPLPGGVRLPATRRVVNDAGRAHYRELIDLGYSKAEARRNVFSLGWQGVFWDLAPMEVA